MPSVTSATTDLLSIYGYMLLDAHGIWCRWRNGKGNRAESAALRRKRLDFCAAYFFDGIAADPLLCADTAVSERSRSFSRYRAVANRCTQRERPGTGRLRCFWSPDTDDEEAIALWV